MMQVMLRFSARVLLFWVLLSASVYGESGAAGYVSLTTAELRTEREHRTVELPYVVQPSDYPQDGGIIQFGLNYELAELPSEPMAILVARASLSGRFFVNGQLVGSCATAALEELRCGQRSYLIGIPTAFLKIGNNSIAVELFADRRSANGLSRLVIGDASTLSKSEYWLKHLMLVEVIKGIIWVCAALGVQSLCIAYLYPQKRELYGWFGLANSMAALSTLLILNPTNLFFSTEFYSWVVYTTRYYSLICTFLAIYALIERLSKRVIFWMIALALLGPTTILLTERAPLQNAISYGPLIVTSLFLGASTLRWAITNGRTESIIIGGAYALIMLAGIHDWLRLLSLLDFESYFYVPFAYGTLFMGIGAFLLISLARSLRIAEMTGDELEELVKVRSHELEQASFKILEMEESALRITDNIPVGTFVLKRIDPNRSQLTFVSGRLARMLKQDKEALMRGTQNLFQRVYEEDLSSLQDVYRHSIKSLKPLRWEGRIEIDGEIRWTKVEANPRLTTNDVWVFEGVVIDVTTVKNYEREIKQNHVKLLEVQSETARIAERETLLQEMHDGFGSQLASALLMSEHRSMPTLEVSQLLRECMADLHLMVDTLGSTSNSLQDALYDFRYRTKHRVQGVDVKLEWSIEVGELPEVPKSLILNLVRVAQECLNNALKHSQASLIRIEFSYLPAHQMVRLSVHDNGLGMPRSAKHGRGIGNMLSRSRKIDGRLLILDANPGTNVVMEICITPFLSQAMLLEQRLFG